MRRARLAAALSMTLGFAACSSGGGTTPPPPPPPALPGLSVADASGTEGNAAAGSLTFTVTLSAPATADAAVHYATADGTATAGTDYQAISGTLTIAAGSTSATVVVALLGDAVHEATETFTLALDAPSANVRVDRASASGTILDDDPPAPPSGRGLDDTGVIRCATSTAIGLPCASPADGTDLFPGQDAERGRDATASDDAEGRAGFAFRKLDAAGAPLADQSAPYASSPWDCVEDLVTGLTWEVHPADGGPRDRGRRYGWYDSARAGEVRGQVRAGTCEPQVACDTEAYVAAINAAGLCGHADWRLPSRGELLGLVDYGTGEAPLVDRLFFPDGRSEAYWTSSVGWLGKPWSVDFGSGSSRAQGRADALALRLVRGG